MYIAGGPRAVVAKVRIIGMVPDIDMKAIVSSAVFQPDSWSAFSFYESICIFTWERRGNSISHANAMFGWST